MRGMKHIDWLTLHISRVINSKNIILFLFCASFPFSVFSSDNRYTLKAALIYPVQTVVPTFDLQNRTNGVSRKLDSWPLTYLRKHRNNQVYPPDNGNDFLYSSQTSLTFPPQNNWRVHMENSLSQFWNSDFID